MTGPSAVALGPSRRRGTGGVVARRAVVRWALRLYRREWRQQVLVLALMTVAVGAAVFAAVAAYNVTPSRDGEFGSADARLRFEVVDAGAVDDAVAAAAQRFGQVDVLADRSVGVAGAVDPVDLRAQDPDGPYGSPMLRLVDGRFPTAPDEVALTDATAALAGGPALGAEVELGRDAFTVVGRVENPADLDDEFALAAPLPDDGAVAGRPAETITFLVRAGEGGPQGMDAPEGLRRGPVEPRGTTERATAAVVVLAVAGVALLLVSLVAAAGFVVVAQRRLRQLGLLAAVGATPRQVRLVTVANGVLVGVVASVLGVGAALLAWVVASPALEEPAGHRIDRFAVPWWLVAAGVVLAVASGTAAAWWPARSVARVAVVDALATRPPRPRRVRRSAVASAVLLVAGVAAISAGIDPVHDEGNLLIVPGVVATVLAVLLVAPAAVRLLAAAGARAPVGVRLAWRDLARYQARSGAALAAASLGLGIAVAVVAIAGAARYTADEGNLADHQLLVRVDTGDGGPDSRLYVPERTDGELADDRDAVDALAAALGDATVVPLEAAVAPTAEAAAGRRFHPALILGRPVSPTTTRHSGLIYVATPSLLDHLGLPAPDDTPSGAAPVLLTTQAGPVEITGNLAGPAPAPGDQAGDRAGDQAGETGAASRAADGTSLTAGPVPDDLVGHIDVPAHTSAPRSLLTPAGLAAGGWVAAPAGWLVDVTHPLTDDEVAAARAAAADAGLTIEARDRQEGLATLRTAATVAGMMLALGLLALTVGLLRGEADRDVRTLTAVGAPRSIRRTVTASTAGGLGLLAALLGTAAAYLALGAGYWPATDRLTGTVPFAHLAALVVGMPVLAAAAGWLLGGREPAGAR